MYDQWSHKVQDIVEAQFYTVDSDFFYEPVEIQMYMHFQRYFYLQELYRMSQEIVHDCK